MNKIRLNNATTLAAENCNELSLYRLLKIVNFMFDRELKITVPQWKYAILFQVLDIKWFNLKFLWLFFKLPKTDIVCSLFPLIKWIEKNKLTDFKLKSFRIFFTRYYAPKDELANITLDEFRLTDKLYIEYKKTNDVDYLDGLVAVLYRKKRADYNPEAVDYKGDIREDFNEFLIPKNSEKSERLSLKKKQLIYLTYEGARNKIIELCPHLFKSEEDQEKGRNFGFGGLILELSGKKFGNFIETGKTNLNTAFTLLEMDAIKAEKQKSKRP